MYRTLIVNDQYPIHIGSGLYSHLPEYLHEVGVTTEQKVMIITDHQVGSLYGEQVKQVLKKSGYVVFVTTFEAGEEQKNLTQVEKIMGACLRSGLDRQSLIIALGGGVVGDIAGFVAATYMRGIPFVQLPTTILAHDSSVGGKTGVNHSLGKNYIGAFHQPLAVLFDTDVLQSLPPREIRSGYAEVIKHGLIRDASFVKWLYQHHKELLSLDQERLAEALYRGCRVKEEIVSIDEKEHGLRAILNYGHTLGHALEAVTDYRLYTHGEAVAIGIAGAAHLSHQIFGFAQEWVEETEELLRLFQLPIQYERHLSEEDLLQAMKRDKKVRQDQYTFVLSRKLGQVEMVRNIEEMPIRTVLRRIRSGNR